MTIVTTLYDFCQAVCDECNDLEEATEVVGDLINSSNTVLVRYSSALRITSNPESINGSQIRMGQELPAV